MSTPVSPEKEQAAPITVRTARGARTHPDGAMAAANETTSRVHVRTSPLVQAAEVRPTQSAALLKVWPTTFGRFTAPSPIVFKVLR
jgi:hypothetical protein